MNHGVLLAVSTAILALFLRVSPLVLAVEIQHRNWGLLNNAAIPEFLRGMLAVVLFDAIYYVTHRTLHWSPWLWRFHQVHHSDPDYDISTGLRFHPLEVAIDSFVFLGGVYLLAPPPWAVVASKLLAEVINSVVHANAILPDNLDRAARRLIVTPHMHRIHHSQQPAEHHGNYGQTFSWWDRLLGTYRDHTPQDGQLRLGLEAVAGENSSAVGFLLAAPFRSAKTQGAADPLVKPESTAR
jgi:sterol desaturase/sphingolipid hydroxylase (fatty acid hydroxylase superfamily)